MFRSFKYLGFNIETNQYEHELIDSDFVTVVIDDTGNESVAVAKEYIRRNLPVAKNMALLYLYIEQQGSYIREAIRWAEIEIERDRILDKLSAMK